MTSVGARTGLSAASAPGGRPAHRGPVVVDRGGGGARLGPGLAVAVEVGRGERPRSGVVLEAVAKRPPVAGADGALGQPGQLEEEHVPGLGELPARPAQGLEHPAGMGDVEDGQALDDLGMGHRQRPRPPRPPSRGRPERPVQRPARGSGPGCRRPAGAARRPRRPPAWRTGCSRACPARSPGIRPRRGPGSGGASCTRSPENRAAAPPAAHPRGPPRRSAAEPRPDRHSRGAGRCR